MSALTPAARVRGGRGAYALVPQIRPVNCCVVHRTHSRPFLDHGWALTGSPDGRCVGHVPPALACRIQCTRLATTSCAPPLVWPSLSPVASHAASCSVHVQAAYGQPFSGRAGRLPVLTALRSHDCCLLTLALVRGVRSSSPSSWCCYLPAAPLPRLRSTRRGSAGSTPCDRLWCGRTCSQPEMDCLT